jgi:hypothetical protein
MWSCNKALNLALNFASALWGKMIIAGPNLQGIITQHWHGNEKDTVNYIGPDRAGDRTSRS